VSKPDHYFNHHENKLNTFLVCPFWDIIYYWNQFHEPSEDGQVGAAWELRGP